MEGNQVYIVIKILGNGNFMKFGTPMATTNYGVYSSQEKANKVIEELLKENPNDKYLIESLEVE